MKKTIAALVAGIVTLALAACAGSPIQLKPITIPVIPPQQLAQTLCPLVQADLDILTSASGLVLLSVAQQNTVQTSIKPKVTAACAAAATIDLTDLQSFNSTAFPALISIVQAVPAIPNQPAILLALQLAQPVLQDVVNMAVASANVTANATATAAAAASGASAAVPASAAQ